MKCGKNKKKEQKGKKWKEDKQGIATVWLQ